MSNNPLKNWWRMGTYTGRLTAIIEEQQRRIEELEQLAFTSYCAGYERGHSDTVEGQYCPPAEYPEEWEEIKQELKSHE